MPAGPIRKSYARRQPCRKRATIRLVGETAREALRDAEQALVQAEQGQRQGLDDEEVDHLAYVAEQKAAIAQSQAVEQRSQDELVQQLRAEQTSRGMVVTGEDVLFEVNGAALQPGAQTELLRLADYLKRNPDRKVLIEGHTDNTGGSDYNLQLSQLRAQSVDALSGRQRRACRSHPRHRLWRDPPRGTERQRDRSSTKSPGRDRHPGCGRVYREASPAGKEHAGNSFGVSETGEPPSASEGVLGGGEAGAGEGWAKKKKGRRKNA